MDVVLIRHPKPALAEGICYGASDIELAAGFEAETETLRTRLGDIADAAIYSSPLRRCRSTAETIGAPLLDERLRELDFGQWELLRWNDIARSELDHWSEDFVNRAPPGGESYASLAARARAFLADAQAAGHRSIVVVTHAGVIRALLAHALGMPLEKSFAFRLDFASLTRLSLSDGHSQLHCMNC
jgi:alpha-ribazole phosphatase